MKAKKLMIALMLGLITMGAVQTTKPVLREAIAAVLVFKYIISPSLGIDKDATSRSYILKKVSQIAHKYNLSVEELLDILENLQAKDNDQEIFYFYAEY